MKNSFFKEIKHDLPAGLVVYFVALPLCLAIAQVSTGQSGLLFSGIIAGVIGGVLVGSLSHSQLGVSGPAAGLVVIVSDGIRNLSTTPSGTIDTMYGFKGLLLAIMIAGLFQLIAGLLKAGIIGTYFPSSVIKGMLAAIGITIILKELPHALGYDKDYLGDMAFEQRDGHNTFSEIYYAFQYNSATAILISVISLTLLLSFESKKLKALKFFKFVPGALIVVILGILMNDRLAPGLSMAALNGEHLVQLPVVNDLADILNFFTFPDFSRITEPGVWKVGITLGLVASIESLLSLEATDKLDPQRRISSPNVELKAQGIGNMVSGLLGGLPITQVIIRSSANINSGARTKLSTIVHGLVLMLTVILIPVLLNKIPLASLACVLFLVGYKLTRVDLFKSMYKLGPAQFIPFLVTIIAILGTDLLKGIAIGMMTAFFSIIRQNYRNAFKLLNEDKDLGSVYRIELSEMVTFINKGVLIETFRNYPEGSEVIIDGSKTRLIDHDVLEMIHEFDAHGSKERAIKLTMINIPPLPVADATH